MMTRRIRRKVGDVVQIPLPDGRYAAGRLYNEASIAILDAVFEHPPAMAAAMHLPVAFVAACFDTAIKDGTWPVIGSIPFENVEDAWAPPRYIEDIINPGTYRIYHKGELRSAAKDESEDWKKHRSTNRNSWLLELHVNSARPRNVDLPQTQ